MFECAGDNALFGLFSSYGFSLIYLMMREEEGKRNDEKGWKRQIERERSIESVKSVRKLARAMKRGRESARKK